jgi:hypothetical protein
MSWKLMMMMKKTNIFSHLIDENNRLDSLGFQDENGFNLKHLKLDSLKLSIKS